MEKLIGMKKLIVAIVSMVILVSLTSQSPRPDLSDYYMDYMVKAESTPDNNIQYIKVGHEGYYYDLEITATSLTGTLDDEISVYRSIDGKDYYPDGASYPIVIDRDTNLLVSSNKLKGGIYAIEYKHNNSTTGKYRITFQLYK